MKIYTIGFTKTSAQHFFERLKKSTATKLIDVRLNNVSQLAGFAKRDDLQFFARQICGIGYTHMSILAPTQSMLSAYRNPGGAWSIYEQQFMDLMEERRIESLKRTELDGGCLLCSEDKPHHCHRRLVAEYLKARWGDVEVEHL